MSPRTRAWRWLELAVVFIIAPTTLAIFMRGYLVFPAIWTLAAISLLILLLDPTFDRRQLWNFRGVTAGARTSILTFIMLAPLLAGALWIYEPFRLLSLPLQRPALWAIIMVGYPILSVYPQELAFRAFFVHRYGLLMTRRELVWTSAVAFGYAHIILHNTFAIAFCTIGGILFTLTYLRTRSLLAASLEHAQYGCYLFTIGWGYYLYGGSINS